MTEKYGAKCLLKMFLHMIGLWLALNTKIKKLKNGSSGPVDHPG